MVDIFNDFEQTILNELSFDTKNVDNYILLSISDYTKMARNETQKLYNCVATCEVSFLL
jgi:hypothetical protein